MVTFALIGVKFKMKKSACQNVGLQYMCYNIIKKKRKLQFCVKVKLPHQTITQEQEVSA